MNEVNANVGNLRPLNPQVEPGRGGQVRGSVGDGAFREQLNALQSTAPTGAATAAANLARLKFSNHAVDRMQTRGIRFSPDEMGRIESAVNKAASKGAKDTLLLTDSAALIVSVKDKTVVTVMDKAALKENVFTNIDSTVVV